MPITLAAGSIAVTDVGARYDLGAGYSTDGVNAVVLGYMLKPGTTWEESTDIQDEEHLTQVASPNSTDRFERYPRVSQGDWSGGARQVFFVDPTRFLSSSGLDVTQPGHLKCLKAAQNVVFPTGHPTGQWYATDGAWTYLAWAGNGNNNAAVVTHTATGVPTLTAFQVGTGAALVGLNHDSEFVLCQVVNSIYNLTGTPTSTLICNDAIGGNMAAATWQGNLYYATSAGVNQMNSHSLTALGGAGVAAHSYTGIIYEIASGDFVYVLTQTGPLNFELHRFDGSSDTLIGYLPITLVYDMKWFGGALYILGSNSASGVAPNYELWSLQGSTLSVVDNLLTTTLFANTVAWSDPKANIPLDGSLAYDGTYVYASYPGLGVTRFNPATGAVSAVVADSVAAVSAHNMISAVAVVNNFGGFLSQYGADLTGATYVVTDINGPAFQAGTLTTSYFDFSTPNTVKVARSFEVQLNAALAAGASVAVSYRLDNQVSYTSLTTVSPNPNLLVAYFPAGVKGQRIQFQITLTPGSNTSPDVASYSVKENLGRVWKFTVVCADRQKLRSGPSGDGEIDNQTNSSGKSKLANIINGYQLAAGRFVLLIPSPTQANGVEQVNATLQDYTYTAQIPGPRTLPMSPTPTSMEGELQLTFTEDI